MVDTLGKNIKDQKSFLKSKLERVQENYARQIQDIQRTFKEVNDRIREREEFLNDRITYHYKKTNDAIQQCIKTFTKSEKELNDYKTEISKFYVDIVKNMKMDPFEDILNSYQKRYADIDSLYTSLVKSQMIVKRVTKNESYQKKLFRNVEELYFFHINEELLFETQTENIFLKEEQKEQIPTFTVKKDAVQPPKKKFTQKRKVQLDESSHQKRLARQQQQEIQKIYSFYKRKGFRIPPKKAKRSRNDQKRDKPRKQIKKFNKRARSLKLRNRRTARQKSPESQKEKIKSSISTQVDNFIKTYRKQKKRNRSQKLRKVRSKSRKRRKPKKVKKMRKSYLTDGYK